MARVTEKTFADVRGWDPQAPRGSRPWCNWVRIAVRDHANQSEFEKLVEDLREMLESKAWENMDPPMKSYDEFKATPYPHGLAGSEEAPSHYSESRVLKALHHAEEELDVATRLDVKTEPLAPAGGKRDGAGRKPMVSGESEEGGNQSSDTTLIHPQERGAGYLLSRLKRDHPELARDYVEQAPGDDGKPLYKSVRAAAIAAGIVKVPTPLERIWRLWEKLSEKDRTAFLRRVTK